MDTTKKKSNLGSELSYSVGAFGNDLFYDVFNIKFVYQWKQVI